MLRVRSSTRRTVLWVLALVAALGVVVVAFAGAYDDDDGGSDTVLPAPRLPDHPGPGCRSASLTEPTDLSAARVVARCGAGAPAARPLTTSTRLRVAVTERDETAAPVLLADQLGEFRAEGLQVEIVDQSAAEAFASLATGAVDVVVGPIDAQLFDAAHAGTGARLVLGGTLSAAPDDTTVAQSGLWFRSDLVSKPGRWDDLADMAVALDDGMRSAATYPATTVLEQGELSLNDVDLVAARGDRAAKMLLGGKVAAAWLDPPAWRRVAETDGFELAATLPASESIDGTVFSARLLDQDRAAGVAYARAVIRTINTDLSRSYHRDDDVMAALARATGTGVADLRATPSLLFDWEIRSGTTERMQKAMIDLGSVAYEHPLPERDLVDRTIALDAIGLRARR